MFQQIFSTIRSEKRQLTLASFPGDIVFFTDELIIVENIKLFSCRQLLATNHTGETVQMKYLVSRFPHKITRGNPLRTPIALGSVPSEK